MAFILGLICGLILGVAFSIISLLILEKILLKYGQPLNRAANHYWDKIVNSTIDNTEIIEPVNAEEVFKKEGSDLEDLLKK